MQAANTAGSGTWEKPNYDSSGEFIGYIGHCFDITEQKIAEAAKTRLLIILESSLMKFMCSIPKRWSSNMSAAAP
jgi:hypothetical protein